jgi:putative endonuclease
MAQMKNRRQVLGRWGEVQAINLLTQKGYQIVEQNARTPYGEIDIVAIQNDELVFVEVKTRTTEFFGLPEDAITRGKKAHILNSAMAYLQEHPDLEGDWRIDVIAIQRAKSREPQIVHFENAITG